MTLNPVTYFVKFLAWWSRKPKLLRFIVFYGTTPIWVPIFTVGGCITMLVLTAISMVQEAWRDFQ